MKIEHKNIKKEETEELPDNKTARQLVKIERYLSEKYEFYFNEITEGIYYRDILDLKSKKDNREYINLTDYKLNSLVREMTLEGIEVSTTKLNELLSSSFVKRVHPIKSYFKDLEQNKDTKDYIKLLSETVIPVDPENKWCEYLTKWLVGSIANVMIDKGCQNHTCLVLTGEQGKFKTTWLDNLCPPTLRDYLFTGKIDPNNKDTYTLIAENLFVNIDDQLRNLNKRDENALKTLITLPSVTYRRPYGRRISKYSHIASFMGSVNGNDFLTDPTGSRRFLPFEVESIDINKAKDLDINKVYSQAYQLYKQGLSYWFNDQEIMELHKSNASFEVHSAEYELIMEYFKPCTRDQATHNYTNTKIKTILEKYTQQRLSSKKIGEALKVIGYDRFQLQISHKRQWVYAVIEKEGEDLAHQYEANKQPETKEIF